MTLEQYIRQLAERFEKAGLFYGHGTDNALDEAFYLVFSGLRLDFSEADRLLPEPVGATARERLEVLVRRRIEERLPVAYLTGEAWFAGMPFHVDERVLVPRSPLAELIVSGFDGLLEEPPRRILDLCTGSGCIGIACAVMFPEARVDLSDIDAGALDVAASNIQRHKLGDRVRAIRSDLFASLTERYDLIISNPPYVSDQEVAALPAEYGHEPVLGLRSDEAGVALPMRILRDAARHLTQHGLLLMEVGYSWPELERRCPRLPFLWLSFDSGGEGVLALGREQLSTR